MQPACGPVTSRFAVSGVRRKGKDSVALRDLTELEEVEFRSGLTPSITF